jgi:hypothetical protein
MTLYKVVYFVLFRYVRKNADSKENDCFSSQLSNFDIYDLLINIREQKQLTRVLNNTGRGMLLPQRSNANESLVEIPSRVPQAQCAPMDLA